MKHPYNFLILLISLLVAGISFHQPVDNKAKSPVETKASVGQLQHTVYFYLNEGVTEEEKAQFEEGLETLMSIDEIHRYQIGKPGPTPEREVTDHEFAYSIFSWFQNMDDYMVYAEHPVHMEFIEEYSHLWADVKVYDSEIISQSDK